MASDKKIGGGCMCGAVRYDTVGEPLYVGHCHCNSCRRHTGAAVATLAIFPTDKVRFNKSDRSIYNSSPGVGRGFCNQCGTTLTWEGNGKISIHISTFDDPNILIPERHWFYKEKISWFDTNDDLPR
jgi:hypothetical protein